MVVRTEKEYLRRPNATDALKEAAMKIALVTVLAAFALLSVPATVATQADQVDVTAAFDAPAQVIYGQPLVFALTIQNRAAEAIEVDLGWDRKANVRVRVNGRSVAVSRPADGGVSRTSTVQVGPHQTYSHRYVLNEWVSFDQPGPYTIELNLDGAFRKANRRIQSPPTHTQLSVAVLPRNADALRQRCEALATEAINAPTRTEQDDAGYALSFFDDPVAVPCVRKVIQATHRFDSWLIRGLGRIGTEDARMVLEELFRSQDHDRYRLASDALFRFRTRDR
jgi:hypothetical protein